MLVNLIYCYWNILLLIKVIVFLYMIMFLIEQEYNILLVCVILSLFFRNIWEIYYFFFGDIQYNVSMYWREVWKFSKRFVIFLIMFVFFNLLIFVICEMRNFILYILEYVIIMLNIFFIFIIFYGFYILCQIK